MQDLEGKVAVITGGASGIGRGMARALAAAGCVVAVADIDEAEAEAVASELIDRGGSAVACPVDVRDQGSVDALAAVARDLGGTDILCNNAGVFLRGDFLDTTMDDWRFVMSVNLDGVFRVGQTFGRAMRDRGEGGHIVNTASVAGFLSLDDCVAYHVSKFGVVGYSEAMRTALAGHGIGVSILAPGPVLSNLASSDRFREPGEEVGGTSTGLTPLLQGGLEPDDVGPLVVQGIRDGAPYIFTADYRDRFAAHFDSVLAAFGAVPG